MNKLNECEKRVISQIFQRRNIDLSNLDLVEKIKDRMYIFVGKDFVLGIWGLNCDIKDFGAWAGNLCDGLQTRRDL